jgi:transcriptional regulator with XRE-family HTH domain
MHERIQAILSAKNIKKVEFAKKLNISQPFASELCSGAKSPSDRTIADICREFDVSETWLRTGEGEMFRELSKDEELAKFFGEVSFGESDFKRRFISVLAQLDESGWKLLEDMALKLAAEAKKEKADH